MSYCAPTFVVAVVAPDQGAPGAAALLKEKLRRRGLRVHVARSLQDPALCECDILLFACRGRQLETLARQIEQLWTQKWAAWYSVIRDAYTTRRNGARYKKKRGARKNRRAGALDGSVSGSGYAIERALHERQRAV